MASGLKFKQIRLGNWKNFTQVDVDLPDRLFLVGPNASGKSNFLDAFRFLRDLASSGGGLQEAVRRRGGVTAIRCLAARRHPDVTVAATVWDGQEDWEYELSFSQNASRQPVVRAERVRRGAQMLLDRPTPEDRADPQRLTQTFLEQLTVNQPFRLLAAFFVSVRYLHIMPQLIREPDRSAGRSNDPFGGDFLEQIAKTSDRKRRARFRQIQTALRVAVPQLQAIELFRDRRGTPHLRGKYQHWRPHGAWQTEEQFSDGTLRLLGLLWAVLEEGGPLLLEEPEWSLHPGVIRYLPQMFARLQRVSGRQVFLSTHSPDLLSDEGIGLNEVFLLRPTSEGTVVEPASSVSEVRTLLEGGLSLAEAVMPRTEPASAAQLLLFE